MDSNKNIFGFCHLKKLFPNNNILGCDAMEIDIKLVLDFFIEILKIILLFMA